MTVEESDEENEDDDCSTDKLLRYTVERCRGIRRLCLGCSNITDEGLSAATSRLPLLEELNISGYFYPETMQVIGRSCPLLKSLIFVKPQFRSGLDDDRAIAIARTMSGLHHLELRQFLLTNNAVKEIVDSCPLLESLDLARVLIMLDDYGYSLDENLRKKIAQHMKKFKHPAIRLPLLYA